MQVINLSFGKEEKKDGRECRAEVIRFLKEEVLNGEDEAVLVGKHDDRHYTAVLLKDKKIPKDWSCGKISHSSIGNSSVKSAIEYICKDTELFVLD